MVVDYKDLENFTTCPRKFYLSRGQEPFYSSTFEDLLFVGFSLENPVVEAEVEGMKLIARPDLVVKEQGGWKIVLKKRAKKFKEKYALEAAYHAFVFTRAGLAVSGVEILSDSFSRRMENWRNLVPVVENILLEMREISEDPDPKVGRHCRYCDFLEDCEKKLLERKSLLLVNGIGEETRRILYEMGIETIEDLSNADQRAMEKIFGKEKGRRFILAARAFLEDRVIVIEPPERLLEGIVVDIEYYPAEERDFLYGFLIDDEYRYFLFDEERDKLVEFLNSLDSSSRFYHYHGPEKRKILKMVENRRFTFLDVFSILKRHFVFPVMSYSLKRIARYLGYEWRVPLNGYEIISLYETWRKTRDAEILKQMILYNEDDVRATKRVLDFMRSHSSFS
ncbi:recombinase RecB [Thermotoga sp. RQ7]|uniref:TM0106 family RecB-like putative nuclease n=1 Tax=Thermotoga sp. RQ7 TaxID=126738 RepID=UPI0005A31AC7|nr:TM0106 family RecB-like putative nuclease [Thermotoga sp. RQ7]AJG40703.1 recombinase RecB [Thermotoga sp. RQ7]